MFYLTINRIRIIFLVLFVVLLIAGSVYLKFVWDSSLEATSTGALKIATISEIALSGEMFKQLRAVPEDLGTVAYESIKKRLTDLVATDKKIRFAYIYTERSGKLYFMADSEPASSKDYSPPGQEYTEASQQVYQPFSEGKSLITKPSTDRWGTWVSVLVPMKDDKTGQVQAVFGLDYPANTWNDEAIFSVEQATLILLSLLLLLGAFYKIIQSNIRTRESEKKFRAFSSSIKDTVVVMDGEGRVVSWNKAAELMFGYPEAEMLGQEFHKYITVKKEHEDKKNILNFGLTGETSVLDKLIELPVKNKEGKEFLVELSVARTQVDGRWHAIGIMRDVTDRKRGEDLIRESAEEAKKALEESERLNKIMVGRELEMAKLKEELKKVRGL